MDRLAAYAENEVPAKAQAALEVIKGIARESGKVVCWSNFVPNLDYFAGLVRRELRLPCFQIDGRVPAGDEAKDDLARPARAQLDAAQTREEIIDEFLDCSGPAVLVTNPASCSESISLHRSCHNALYLDRTYDCALFLQSIDRIHRLGLPLGARVRVHVLMATSSGRNTIDQLVDASLLRKERTMMQLLLGAELLPFHLHEDPLEDAQGDEEDLGQLLRYLLGES